MSDCWWLNSFAVLRKIALWYIWSLSAQISNLSSSLTNLASVWIAVPSWVAGQQGHVRSCCLAASAELCAPRGWCGGGSWQWYVHCGWAQVWGFYLSRRLPQQDLQVLQDLFLVQDAIEVGNNGGLGSPLSLESRKEGETIGSCLQDLCSRHLVLKWIGSLHKNLHNMTMLRLLWLLCNKIILVTC